MKIIKLEAIRGFVALYIVIHHFILFTTIYTETPAIIKLFFRFGREAVLIFFLLSGFVICLAIKKKSHSGFYDYFKKRALRIYPILLIAFLISMIISCSNGYIFSADTFKSLLCNTLQLQRPADESGAKIPAFLNNLPLWSLSYEWWFYMMFFPFYQLIKKYNKQLIVKDIYLVLIFSMISWIGFLFYPSHLLLVPSFFLLWWTGFYCGEIYHENMGFKFKDMIHPILCLLIMAAVMGIPVVKIIVLQHKTIAEVNNQYPLTNYVYNYVEAAILLILGQLWWNIKLFRFNTLFGWFRNFAPISYAMYIIHFPIIQLKMPFITNIYLLLSLKLIMILALSYIMELQIQPWIMKIYRLFDKADKKKMIIAGV